MQISVNSDICISIPELKSELNWLGRNLYLNNLKEIIISDNYENDIAKRTRKGKSPEAQDDEVGTSFGRTLEAEDDNTYYIVVRAVAILNLQSTKNRNMILHLLQHELAHVHDDSLNYSFYKSAEENGGFVFSTALISEYSADRLSAETNMYLDNYGIDKLKEWFAENSKIVENLKRNISDSSVEKVIWEVSRYHNQFLRELTSYFALIDACSDNLVQAENVFMGQLSFIGYKRDIIKFHKNLYDLFENKNSIHGNELLAKIEKDYHQTYSVWGIKFRNTEEGMSVAFL